MSDQNDDGGDPSESGPQPVFLLPGVVTALAGLLVAIHLAATFVLNSDSYLTFLQLFAYLPVRIPVALAEDPTYALPLLWTPITHALLHDGWEHLLVNTAWLAIFATPVARRYGASSTLLVFFASAVAGAAAFTITNLNEPAFLIGASGGVSGLTGAAVRFIFQPVLIGRDEETGQRVVLGRRLLSLGGILQEPRARAFTLIWIGLNAAVPLLPAVFGISGIQIAWEAHLGGFIAGLLLAGWLERGQ
ncbi:rhomboid family intramembrane serine protease [Devosia pacifica]|uniref:Rhomboid family intramembrane serine protease n=1 Tax=Devosia pacifica TaxID=1335967 RepID=A0A918RWQ7_9HYPH|nr:rhomboid family intramembrane serine protease [Devosia pacifica]GHA13995.1 rhomboid family intramembrane serine protease [Devosia pacifica]